MVEIICKNCGKVFKVKNARKDTAKYCCKQCRLEAEDAKIIIKCKHCGKEFQTTKCHINRKYCSDECKKKDLAAITILRVCKTCGKEFEVPVYRQYKAAYCSRECCNNGLRAEKNLVCPICGKLFHRKPYHLKKFGKSLGVFCSKECLNKAKEIAYQGEGNHQFGLKGDLNASFKGGETISFNHKLKDIMVYAPEHCRNYITKGRIKKQRLLVELNHEKYNASYFDNVNGVYLLKRGVHIHHIDGNHNNNSIDNLIPCTAAEHNKYHHRRIIERDKLGKIIKSETGVLKQGELLENLEVGNQQPSMGLTTHEGSETRY